MPFTIIQSTFNFECTMCGNCCTGDQKVNLNLYDLYKLTQFRNLENTRQLFEEKIVQLVKAQNNAWIPQIFFKSLKKTTSKKQLPKHNLIFCPFLINELDDQNNLKGLCSLHPDKKPLICAMAPVGRILDLKSKTEKFVFVKPAPDCPGVESEKENRLIDLQKSLSTELGYEKRFYKILDNLQDKDQTRSFYLENIYSFATTTPFEEILNQH